MKRTELKRGTSKLKRAPMKKRAKRHRDTPASLAVRKRYRLYNPTCEVSAFLKKRPLGTQEWVASLRLSRVGGVPQIDHMWGGTAGRIDVVSMLISVDQSWHQWKTDNFTLGLLLFLVVKQSKCEVNADEFRQCSGYHLVGWLSQHRAEWPVCLVPYLEELVKSLE